MCLLLRKAHYSPTRGGISEIQGGKDFIFWGTHTKGAAREDRIWHLFILWTMRKTEIRNSDQGGKITVNQNGPSVPQRWKETVKVERTNAWSTASGVTGGAKNKMPQEDL